MDFRVIFYLRFYGIFAMMQLPAQHIEQIKAFFSDLPVKKAYLFGSYSRGEADENSDIDIAVELDYSKPIGFQFFGYGERLQELLKHKVDLVTYEGLSEFVKPYVDKDKVLIYEK